MSPHETDRRHLERQIVYARPIVVLLSLLALLQHPNPQEAKRSILFLIAYLIVSLSVIPLERFLRKRAWHLPIACDLLALGFFMYISPSSVPVWFPYLFICWVAGMRWGLRAAFPLAGALALILVLLTAVKGEIGWMRVIAWMGLVGGTFAGGAALAFLADRSRHFASQNDFFSRITATLQVDQGLAESLRLMLDELARAFQVESTLLAYRDTDLERIYLWRLKTGEASASSPKATRSPAPTVSFSTTWTPPSARTQPRRPRQRFRLGPPRWAPPQHPPAPPRPHSAGAQYALHDVGGL